jgi:hypothetical protein
LVSEKAPRGLALPRVDEQARERLVVDVTEIHPHRREPLAPPDLLASLGPTVDCGEDAAFVTFMCAASHWVAKILPPTRKEGRP